jgi:hypothetical protein
MGLSQQDVRDITAGWRETTERAMRAIAKSGGWVWQMFSGIRIPSSADEWRERCATQDMRMGRMSLELQGRGSHGPLVAKDAASDVARFLLVRGPWAFLGTGWVGCTGMSSYDLSYTRPKEFDVDYGTPLGLCKEDTARPGVFVREFTKCTAMHDTATGKSSIKMKDAASESSTVVRVGLPNRTNNIRFLSFYGNGNAEQVTAADQKTLVNVNANMIATNNLTVCEQAWHGHRLKCMLTVDWV